MFRDRYNLYKKKNMELLRNNPVGIANKTKLKITYYQQQCMD